MKTDERQWDDKHFEEAQQRFEKALSNLSTTVVHTAKDAVKDVETELRSSLHNLSTSAVNSISQVKQELNLARTIRKDPWSWMVGATCTGIAAGIILFRKTPRLRSYSQAPQAVVVTRAPIVVPAATKKFSMPMLFLDVAIMLWKLNQSNKKPANRSFSI